LTSPFYRMKKAKETFVLDLGGSLFAPNGEGGRIDIQYLKRFEGFIRKQVAKKRRFFIVSGGGFVARAYRDAAKKATGIRLTDEDLDWLGIHATRLNAHLFRTIFRDIAYERILKHYDMVDKKATQPVVICAGWQPGWSTDYCAVLVANDYHVDTVIKISNFNYVYDKDPAKFKNAKPLKKMSWDQVIKLVGDKWKPGLHTPFDPVAARMAKRIGLRVVTCHGKDFANLAKVLSGKRFKGTVIE
jgi:uridylate kinase